MDQDDNLKKLIIGSPKLFISFIKDKCNHCDAIRSIIKEYSEQNDIILVELDKDDELNKTFEIVYYPTLLVVENSQIKAKIIGTEQIKNLLK
jgi:thiol-disulfide isomerase/thioredoxin